MAGVVERQAERLKEREMKFSIWGRPTDSIGSQSYRMSYTNRTATVLQLMRSHCMAAGSLKQGSNLWLTGLSVGSNILEVSSVCYFFFFFFFVRPSKVFSLFSCKTGSPVPLLISSCWYLDFLQFLFRYPGLLQQPQKTLLLCSGHFSCQRMSGQKVWVHQLVIVFLRVSFAVIKHHSQKQSGEGMVYFSLQLAVCHEGKSGEVKAGTE